MDALVEYNPETLLAKAGLRVAEKEAKKEIKSEFKKTLKMVGLTPEMLKEYAHELMDMKDSIVETIQDASQFGFEQTFGPYLQLTGNIFKKVREYLNPKGEVKDDADPVMKKAVELTKLGIPVTLSLNDEPKPHKTPALAPGQNPVAAMKQNLMANPYAQRMMANPFAQKMMANPYAQRMMRGGKREKGPAEEIEETLSMLLNHRLWVLDQAKNKSQAKTKKRTIKKKKMIKNPKKKGTRKGSK